MGSACDQLLAAVDVEGRSGEGRVDHDVYGERGDVGRSDDPPDGKRGSKLIAAVFEFIAEERCRQRCVNEACGDEVDADGRELEREVLRHGGMRGRESRDERKSPRRAAATDAAHEEQGPSRANLAHGLPGDLQRQ